MKRVRRKTSADEGGGNYFASPKSDIQFISTGCKTLDLALGGGWAQGRVGNIVGDKSTGKTLLCIEAAVNFAMTHPKGEIYYVEAEAAFDDKYAAALGLPLDRVTFAKTPEGDSIETVEEMYNHFQSVLDKAAKKGTPVLYILDSLDSLSDKAEMKRGFDEGSYGADKPKQMSKLFRRIVRKIEATNALFLVVSQVRDNMNAMSFGRKTKRSGGRALDFYASQVIYLVQVKTLKKTVTGIKRAVGVELLARVDKNKVGLPFREAQFSIEFGYGIDDVSSCLEFLKTCKSLSELEIPDKQVTSTARQIKQLSFDEYSKEMRRIHRVTERRWYEIENSFMPSRSKYGG